MTKLFHAILAASTLLASAAAAGEGPPSDLRQLRGRRNGKKSSSDSSDSSASSSSDDDDGGCPDPQGAVLDLLDCVASEDSACVAAAYDPGFERFHNELFTGEIPVSDTSFWDGAFLFVDLSFDIKFSDNPGPNQASVRYVENVVMTNGENFGLPESTTYPFGVSFDQHEHAIVTVDDDCKLVKWDQYGDNKEQTDVDDASMALSCVLGRDSCVDP
ncbi:unnamed protein product [Scytosiphon promiscuus]